MFPASTHFASWLLLSGFPKGKKVEQTSSLFTILAEMAQHPRRYFSVEKNLDRINPDGTATDRSLYDHIER
jgi:DNA-binding response OmpR family regulator